MDFDLAQLRTLLIALVGMIVLLFSALILYIVLSSRQKASQREKEREGTSHPDEPKIPQAPRLQVGQSLSLIRDAKGGPLQVEVGGVKYRSLDDAKEPEVKRQIILAAMELVRFTGVLGKEASGPAPMDKTYRWREDLREGSQEQLDQIRSAATGQTPEAGPAQTEIEQQFLSLLAEMGQASSPIEKPTFASSIRRALKSGPSPEEHPHTFVDDIEAIIQRRIRLIPAFQERELHVHADPSGAVRFDFDGRQYQDVGDIPNMTARQLIADAIREWEETT